MATELRLRRLSLRDAPCVTRIDAHHTGASKPAYWRGVLAAFLARPRDGRARVGLAALEGTRLVGYLLGEVRAFEFGSEPCGWIFAVGVDPTGLRRGVGGTLLREACRLFRESGVSRVRTMVRRSDVPVLAFFRASGFAGGSYVQLELDVTS